MQVINWVFWLTVVSTLNTLYSQRICTQNEEPSSLCNETCTLCDIDGLVRSINVNNTLSIRKTGCDSGSGDAYGFIAMSTSLVVEVFVGVCGSSNGTPTLASFVIYEDSGTCNDTLYGWQLDPFTECNDNNGVENPQWIGPNSSKIFKTTRNLTVGQQYYFEVGTGGDVTCDYSIKVLEGSTKVPQLTAFTLDNIYDPCQGETVDYTVLNPEPITDYVYTLDGRVISTDEAAQVTYANPGTYELCITGSNPCSQAAPTCYTITVNPPSSTIAEDYLCPGECYTTPATTLCDAGTYDLILTDQNGCDSLVTLTLLDRTPEVTDLQATICNGDSLRYLGQTYSSAGVYPSTLTNRFGCDSTVNLEIVLAACPLTGNLTSTDVACYDGSDGSLRFQLTSGSPPYRYDFRRLGGGPTGSGTVARREELTTLTGLPAGTYLIEVADDFGSIGYFNTEIKRPAAIELTLQTEQYNGSDLSCTDSADGIATVLGSGGTGRFTYTWSPGGAETDRITDLPAGTYSVTATDERACTHTESITLVAPPPLALTATVDDEECSSPSTGKLSVPTATGGTGSVSFDLVRDSDPIAPSQYNSLPAGAYLLTARDQNGCRQDTTLLIEAPVRPEAIISPTDPYIALGDELTLRVSDQPGNTYQWSPADSLSCTTCPTLTVRPTEQTTYRVTVTSPDSCTATDEVVVFVDRRRRVYVPNAFSPNADGTNDLLIVYPGQAVRRLKKFAVYDRWGGLRFQVTDVDLAQLPSTGWDGQTNGKPAVGGVYVWQAEVEFIDGGVEIFRGSVALIE